MEGVIGCGSSRSRPTAERSSSPGRSTTRAIGGDGPFIPVNCGSIARDLLESELFGHAAGAFTGANPRGRHGLFHAAAQGTLFLDEVAEMSLGMQAALLRVLESGEYHRVGATEIEVADVRIICATCGDLPGRVEAGTFRRDLYYRLRGVTIELALVLSRGTERIELEHLPTDLRVIPEPSNPGEREVAEPLTEIEGRAIRRVLDEVAGNVSAAAARLGVARSTLYRMMRRHRLIS